MKKSITILIALLMVSLTSAYAQNKGDMFISGSLGTDLGFGNAILSNGSLSEKSKNLYSPSASLDAEFGYFPINNLKLAFSLGYGMSANRYYSSTNTVLSEITNVVYLNPNVAYYVKLADRFYYAPEVGFAMGIGKYSEPVSDSVRKSYGLMSYSAYLQPVAFECKVNEHWAIGFSLVGLNYICNVTSDKDTGYKLTRNTVSLDISSSCWVRYYF